jgi:hypothetical protein
MLSGASVSASFMADSPQALKQKRGGGGSIWLIGSMGWKARRLEKRLVRCGSLLSNPSKLSRATDSIHYMCHYYLTIFRNKMKRIIACATFDL